MPSQNVQKNVDFTPALPNGTVFVWQGRKYQINFWFPSGDKAEVQDVEAATRTFWTRGSIVVDEVLNPGYDLGSCRRAKVYG